MVDDAPGSADNDVHPLAHLSDLRALCGAPVDSERRQLRCDAVELALYLVVKVRGKGITPQYKEENRVGVWRR